jgi:hypothetical protein
MCSDFEIKTIHLQITRYFETKWLFQTSQILIATNNIHHNSHFRKKKITIQVYLTYSTMKSGISLSLLSEFRGANRFINSTFTQHLRRRSYPKVMGNFFFCMQPGNEQQSKEVRWVGGTSCWMSLQTSIACITWPVNHSYQNGRRCLAVIEFLVKEKIPAAKMGGTF